MHCQIMDPNDKDRHVDGKDPEHEDEEGMCVVEKIVMCTGALRSLSVKEKEWSWVDGGGVTVSLAIRNARVQVDICTMQATTYAN